MTQHEQTEHARSGQRIALIMAGVGLFWIIISLIATGYGWSNRTRVFFDLAVLAGFGFALWQTFKLWRTRQNEKGET